MVHFGIEFILVFQFCFWKTNLPVRDSNRHNFRMDRHVFAFFKLFLTTTAIMIQMLLIFKCNIQNKTNSQCRENPLLCYIILIPKCPYEALHLTFSFCLLVSSADDFASCLDPHQVRQYVGPNLALNCLTLPWYT